MLRAYHKHTGLDGIRYFARQPSNADGARELLAGGWAATREEQFHRLSPHAGHSVARHGPHVPDSGAGNKLERRVKTGIAPDDEAAFTRKSSRFLSFVDWCGAHDSAYIALKEQFPGFETVGPIKVTRRGQERMFPKASGYITFRVVDNPGTPVSRSLGRAFEGVDDGTEQTVTMTGHSGVTKSGLVYANTAPISAASVTYVRATLGWTGNEWILFQMYPSNIRGTTRVGLEKAYLDGASTI